MGIDGFDHAATYNCMCRSMRAAGAKDRKERQKQGATNASFARGETEGNRPDHVQCESIQWILKMRDMFQGHLIRRDHRSKDFAGKSIIDLTPYRHQLVELTLTEREMERMTVQLQALPSSDRRIDGEVSRYLQNCPSTTDSAVHCSWYCCWGPALRCPTKKDTAASGPWRTLWYSFTDPMQGCPST